MPLASTTDKPHCSCGPLKDDTDGTALCPLHANNDPCEYFARVTGKRYKRTIRRNTCANCGWTAP